MKYVCEGCERLVAPAAFRLEEGALVLDCERCGAPTRAQLPQGASEARAAAAAEPAGPHAPPEAVARSPAPALRVVSLRPSGETVRQAAELARSEDPFAPPPGHCPKCLARRPEDALVCAACGLVYANFRPEEHRPSGPLGEAWLGLLAHWDEEERHERFVQLAVARGELAGAGRLYRLRLAQAPQDPYAQRGRDEVLRLASASSAAALAQEHTPPERSARTRTLLLLLVVAVALVAGVLLVRQLQVLLAGPPP